MSRSFSGRKRNSGTLGNVLLYASEAVLLIDSGRVTLDEALDHAPADFRRTLEHLMVNIYRFRKSIRKSWQKFCRKKSSPEIAALLDTALTQCRFQTSVEPYSVVNVAVTLAKKHHADKFVNAVLRAVLAEKFSLPERADDILPDEVLSRWRKFFLPEEVEKFAGLFLTPAPFTFRLCDDSPLPDGACAVEAFPPFVFGTTPAPGKLLASPEFADGSYYIQDPAASLAVALAAPHVSGCRTLLDLCCAPGGKTLMAAELLGPAVEITAADISARRQKLTAENFARHRKKGRIITAAPEDISGVFDWVIADLPCSNTGVFRRRPDALWRFSEKSLSEVMTLQKSILRRAAELTAPGGWLLCSSCSIEADENEAFAGELSGFTLIAGKTLLPDQTHDGAFAALWQKVH